MVAGACRQDSAGFCVMRTAPSGSGQLSSMAGKEGTRGQVWGQLVTMTSPACRAACARAAAAAAASSLSPAS